ncbi:MAG: FHA domain-containing protein [Aggregatilineales bacterium]
MSGATRLILLDGLTYLPGRQFLPLDRFPFVIGRARECELVVDSTQISRQHARLELDHDQVIIIDLGSTNGSSVNGERLTPREPRRLRAGDKINLGGVCTLEFDDPGTTLQAWTAPMSSLGMALDEDAAQVLIDGQAIDPPLSPGQFMLLALLAHNEGRVVTREEVRAHIWGREEEVTDQTIDALVSRLRKRLDEADPTHEYVVTRRGFGLMFHNRTGMPPVQRDSEPAPTATGETTPADPIDPKMRPGL